MSEQEARDFLTALGGEIVLWRRRRHLNRAQLGELVDLSDSTVGRIERGQEAGTPTDIWRIANALGVPFSTLIQRAEDVARLSEGDGIE